jgi:hypothetical protein
VPCNVIAYLIHRYIELAESSMFSGCIGTSLGEKCLVAFSRERAAKR